MSESNKLMGRADAELWSLIEAHCDGVATPDEKTRLESRLEADADVRRFFVAYMQEQAQIAWLARGERAPQAGAQSAPAARTSPVLGFLGAAARLSVPLLSSPRTLALTVAGGLVTYFIGLMISIAISRADFGQHNPQDQIEALSGARRGSSRPPDVAGRIGRPGRIRAALCRPALHA